MSFEEQTTSKDKYASIFSRQMEVIVFIILQIFFAKRAVLKMGEYPRIFPSFSWGIFGHVTRLDQSQASENIWWIIKPYIRPLHANFAPLASLPYSTAKASFSTHLPYSGVGKSLLLVSILVLFKLRVPFVAVSAMWTSFWTIQTLLRSFDFYQAKTNSLSILSLFSCSFINSKKRVFHWQI